MNLKTWKPFCYGEYQGIGDDSCFYCQFCRKCEKLSDKRHNPSEAQKLKRLQRPLSKVELKKIIALKKKIGGKR